MPLSPWNELIASLSNPHLLQTQEWAEVKQAGGWRPIFLVWNTSGWLEWKAKETLPADQPQAACLLLIRPVFPALGRFSPSLAYAPKGPNLDWSNAELRRLALLELVEIARANKALFLKIDPDILIAIGEPESSEFAPNPDWVKIERDLLDAGFHPSQDQIQFRNSVLLELGSSPEEILEQTRPKTRYNIRLAERKGVTVRVGGAADTELLYKMYAETAKRDGFIIRGQEYYRLVWEQFSERSAALIAEVEGEAIAAVYLFHFAGVAYYLYGMSRDAHREKMPNALLQYRAALWAKEQGCSIYDLWGAPDVFDETDRMWGVYKFKRGFGGTVRLTPGAYDRVINKLGSWFYARLIPMFLNVARWLARRRPGRGLD